MTSVRGATRLTKRVVMDSSDDDVEEPSSDREVSEHTTKEGKSAPLKQKWQDQIRVSPSLGKKTTQTKVLDSDDDKENNGGTRRSSRAKSKVNYDEKSYERDIGEQIMAAERRSKNKSQSDRPRRQTSSTNYRESEEEESVSDVLSDDASANEKREKKKGSVTIAKFFQKTTEPHFVSKEEVEADKTKEMAQSKLFAKKVQSGGTKPVKLSRRQVLELEESDGDKNEEEDDASQDEESEEEAVRPRRSSRDQRQAKPEQEGVRRSGRAYSKVSYVDTWDSLLDDDLIESDSDEPPKRNSTRSGNVKDTKGKKEEEGEEKSGSEEEAFQEAKAPKQTHPFFKSGVREKDPSEEKSPEIFKPKAKKPPQKQAAKRGSKPARAETKKKRESRNESEEERFEVSEKEEEPTRKSSRATARRPVSYKTQESDFSEESEEDSEEEQEEEGDENVEGEEENEGEASSEDNLGETLLENISEPPPVPPHTMGGLRVEKILDVREGADGEEFQVKCKGVSYRHLFWLTRSELEAKNSAMRGRIQRFLETPSDERNYDEENIFNPEFIEVERIVKWAGIVIGGETKTQYLVKWSGLPYEDSTWELEDDIKDAPDQITAFQRNSSVPPAAARRDPPRPFSNSFKPLPESPAYKGGHVLLDYQLEGLNWMVDAWYHKKSCILADEMGLGKTVQAMSFIHHLHTALKYRGPFLVIAPLSTIPHWKREFEGWTDMNVLIYHGSAASREIMRENEFYFSNSKGQAIPHLYRFHVLITTYEMITKDTKYLKNIPWRAAVVDEAHRLKNTNCRLQTELRGYTIPHRVLLSGTPLQNNVEEVWSLLNFMSPDQFDDKEGFLEKFGNLETEEEVMELQNVLKKYMLRRVKEDVQKSIAPKQETIIQVELTTIQKQYYRAIFEKNFKFLAKGMSAPNLNNIAMELRKCCLHPYLINGCEEMTLAQAGDRHAMEVMVSASGKMVLLDKLLPKLKAGGHRVLIFSQMTKCLDLLEDYVNWKGYGYERIDGSITGDLRQQAIDRFSKPDSDKFVFLLSTKAGGLGINLVAADTVIIYDSDWNPQNDVQAQARCHRIGQKQQVKIYRLVTHNTYEEDQFKRASMKLGLERAVLGTLDRDKMGANGKMSKKVIEELVKKGAYGAVMDKDDDGAKFCAEDIEDILEKRTLVVTEDAVSAGSTFSKAVFSSEAGGEDLDVRDDNFWQKWAEKADVNASALIDAPDEDLIINAPRQRKATNFARMGGEVSDGDASYDSDDSRGEKPKAKKGKGRTALSTASAATSFEKLLTTWGWGRWAEIRSQGKQLGDLSDNEIKTICTAVLCSNLSHPDIISNQSYAAFANRLLGLDGEPADLAKIYQSNIDKALELAPFLAIDDYTGKNAARCRAFLAKLQLLDHLNSTVISPQLAAQIDTGTPVSKLTLPEGTQAPGWWGETVTRALVVGMYKHGWTFSKVVANAITEDPQLQISKLVMDQAEKGKGGEDEDWTDDKFVATKLRSVINLLQSLQGSGGSEGAGGERKKRQSIEGTKETKQARRMAKKEKKDFERTILYLPPPQNLEDFDWAVFRKISQLTWSDQELLEYTRGFLAMIAKVIEDKKEEREEKDPENASRGDSESENIPRVTLQTAQRFKAREQTANMARNLLKNPHLSIAMGNLYLAAGMPSWWVQKTHDKMLLQTIAKYGYHFPDCIVSDPEFNLEGVFAAQKEKLVQKVAAANRLAAQGEIELGLAVKESNESKPSADTSVNTAETLEDEFTKQARIEVESVTAKRIMEWPTESVLTGKVKWIGETIGRYRQTHEMAAKLQQNRSTPSVKRDSSESIDNSTESPHHHQSDSAPKKQAKLDFKSAKGEGESVGKEEKENANEGGDEGKAEKEEDDFQPMQGIRKGMSSEDRKAKSAHIMSLFNRKQPSPAKNTESTLKQDDIKKTVTSTNQSKSSTSNSSQSKPAASIFSKMKKTSTSSPSTKPAISEKSGKVQTENLVVEESNNTTGGSATEPKAEIEESEISSPEKSESPATERGSEKREATEEMVSPSPKKIKETPTDGVEAPSALKPRSTKQGTISTFFQRGGKKNETAAVVAPKDKSEQQEAIVLSD